MAQIHRSDASAAGLAKRPAAGCAGRLRGIVWRGDAGVPGAQTDA